MAKRRRKRKSNSVDELLKFSFVGGFLLFFWLTKSFVAGAIAAVLFLAFSIGILIVIRNNRIEMLKRSGIADVDKMDGFQFEHYLGHLFRSQGYQAEVTQASGDYGVDLILKAQGRKIAVQAKCYKNNVGLSSVQEVYAGKTHYGATEAWVVTNSHFTEQAITLAKSSNVRLINRDELIEMMLKMNAAKKPAGSTNEIKAKPSGITMKQQEQRCSLCGGTMIQRKSTKGIVLACSNFPTCKNIQPFA